MTWRWSWPARLAFVLTGVVLPVACFLFASGAAPEWQSGEIAAYAELMLSWKPSSAFYPFLLYSMVSMILLVVAPGRFPRYLAVRAGIYMGVLLAVQYWVLVFLMLAGDEALAARILAFTLWSVVAVSVPWGVGWTLAYVGRKLGPWFYWCMLGLSLGPVVLVAIDVARPSDESVFNEYVRFVLFASLVHATPWAVAAYGSMAFYLLRHRGERRRRRMQFSLMQLLGCFTWLGAYLGAWRLSVTWMLQEYAKLPTEPPQDCYVCTAAARGHRRLVGARHVTTRGGRHYLVNDQMRYLKAAELLLASITPRGHRVCRRLYDRVGPVLARLLVHPLLADVAYLALKPAEWAARAVFRGLLPGGHALVDRIYRDGGRENAR